LDHLLIWLFQDLDKVDNSSDEMELYAAIGRKFRTLFMRQEHMKTFKAYDRLEVCSVGYKISYKIHNYK
jgi:hypothetical protein